MFLDRDNKEIIYIYIDVCKSSSQNNLEHVCLSLLLICNLEMKTPTNGLNGTAKIHHIQMKSRSRSVVLDQKLTPVPQLQQNYLKGVGITSYLHYLNPPITKKLK